MDADMVGPPRLGLVALFVKFLGFGALAFGGPVAQIAMLREALVEREGWIDAGRFNRLLAVLQVLPGPEAHELCVHMGMIARGRWGGLLAGLGFMLPGFGLMVLAAWAYGVWIAGVAGWAGVLLGVQLAVLAVILRSVVRIGQHVVVDWPLALIAAASVVAVVLGVAFWIPLVAAGLVYAAWGRPFVVAGVILGAVVVAGLVGFVEVRVVGGGAAVSLPALFVAGLKGRLLTFGGAYTAIPYVRADTVGRGWIGDAAFLDGVAVAGMLPAPLVIFATFVGFVVGGLAGAVVITMGMFLPAFAFSMIFFERLEAVVANPALHRGLAGVAAGVIGVIFGTFVALLVSVWGRVGGDLVAVGVFLGALGVVWGVRGVWVVPGVLVAGGGLGWVLL